MILHQANTRLTDLFLGEVEVALVAIFPVELADFLVLSLLFLLDSSHCLFVPLSLGILQLHLQVIQSIPSSLFSINLLEQLALFSFHLHGPLPRFVQLDLHVFQLVFGLLPSRLLITLFLEQLQRIRLDCEECVVKNKQ